MPRSVRHTERARNDLIDIWNYYDEVGATAAGEKLMRKIARALETLGLARKRPATPRAEAEYA